MIASQNSALPIVLLSEKPKVQIVNSSKKLIDELLSMNTKNRKPKTTHIDRLVKDITTGKFHLTASGVGVSSTGILLDGQHRLLAIRQAGYPAVPFVLATGLDEGSQVAIDRHAKRSLSDALTLHMNVTISAHMVALANTVFQLKAMAGKYEPFAFTKSGLTDVSAAEFMAEYGDLAAEIVQSSGSARAPVMAALFVYALHDHDKAIEFARDINKGVGLAEDHPAYRLRSAIERLKRATDATGRMELLKVSVSAVISHAHGRPVKQLKGSDSWANAPWKWGVV